MLQPKGVDMVDFQSSFRRYWNKFIVRIGFWFLGQFGKRDNPNRRETPETEKLIQARRMLESLHSRRAKLRAKELIDSLYEIHSFFRLPWYYPGEHEQNTYLMAIIVEIGKSNELNVELTKRLIWMLSWSELQGRSYTKDIILSAAKKFKSPEFLPELRSYAGCLLARRQTEERATADYWSLGNEIKAIEELIIQCESA
jgi:hypothetical protein